jgi:lipopolysaccharide transport system permease protein
VRISARAPSLLSTLRELWDYRDLLVALGARDLRVRYRQTALGVAWVVLQPLVTAGLFAVVFGRIAGLSANGNSYFVFSLAALAAWNFFAAIVTRASGSLIAHPQLISRVYFPRLVLPLSVVPAALVDLAVTTVAFTLIAATLDLAPGVAIATMPLIAVLLAMLALGPAMIAAALSVRYRDVQHIIPVAVQMALFASPVAYAAAAVPADWRGLYDMNPLLAPLELTRWALLGTPAPAMGQIAFSVAVALVLWVAGVWFFRRAEQSFADEI